MELKFEARHALCEPKEFIINGIKADKYDFGIQEDNDHESAEPHGCGNMEFTRIPFTKEVLKKYSITEQEYSEICEQLESGLSFGNCGWCV